MTWKLDDNNHEKYIQLCKDAVADDNVFSWFRSMDPMTMIVENSPVKSGGEYYNHIKKYHPLLLAFMDELKKSDTVGSPALMEIEGNNISPSTLRYIKTVVDLRKHFGSLDGKTIVEIGGGYGGLCKIIYDVYKPKEYAIYDLPVVQKLQQKFLREFGVYPILPDQHIEAPEIDLLIAMYSWSELSEDLQIDYLSKVIKKAKNCYIMLNHDIERSYQILKDAFPNADIQDYHIFEDESITDYAPYDRYIIIKNNSIN